MTLPEVLPADEIAQAILDMRTHPESQKSKKRGFTKQSRQKVKKYLEAKEDAAIEQNEYSLRGVFLLDK